METKKHLLSAIVNRWSPFSFSDLAIPKDKIKLLFEAARLAPSSFNEQPWIFVVAAKDDHKAYAAFAQFLHDTPRKWATEGYLLVVVLAKTKYSHNGEPYYHSLYDTGMAVENLCLQAASMGIFVHQINEFSTEAVAQYLDIDDTVVPVTMMAVGYLGYPTEVDETRRSRRPLHDFVFTKKMGEPFKFE